MVRDSVLSLANSEVSGARPFTGWVQRGSLVVGETIALFSWEVKQARLRLTVCRGRVLSRVRRHKAKDRDGLRLPVFMEETG